MIKNGIIFVWSEKEILGRLIKIMEEKNFMYIENMQIALIDPSKADPSFGIDKEDCKFDESKLKFEFKNEDEDSLFSETNSTTESNKLKEDEANNERFLKTLRQYNGIEVNDILFGGDAPFLKKSKKVLMMFRRVGFLKFQFIKLE